MTKPTLSAIRAMIAAQAPDQTVRGQEILATKLSFITKHDPEAYAKPKKERKKPEYKEEALQLTLASYLRTQPRIFWWYNHKQVIRGKARKGQLGYMAKVNRMGARKGLPDIMMLFDGKLVAAELKAPKSELSEEQVFCLAEIEKRKGYAGVVKSLDDLIGLLERAGYWK